MIQPKTAKAFLAALEEDRETRLYSPSIKYKAALSRKVADTLKNNTVLVELKLWDNKIGPSGAKHLAGALHVNKTLTELDLHGNNIGDTGASDVSEALKVNKALKALNLGHNGIGPSGARDVADALRENETLQTLSLLGNLMGPSGAKHLAGALHVNKTLTELNLTWNFIRQSGAEDLAVALHVNQTLTSLNLYNNDIRNDGARALLAAMDKNQSVTYLDLGGNDIDDESIEDAVRAKLKSNQAYAKKLMPALETPVGAVLMENGFTRLALAFYEGGVHTIEKAGELTRSELKTVGKMTLAERKKLEGLFGIADYQKTAVGKLLAANGFAHYAEHFYHDGVYEVEALAREDIEGIGVSDSNDREAIFTLLSGGGSTSSKKRRSSRQKKDHTNVKYDCFLTHNWLEDELGRSNHDTVSKVNAALKRKGLNTWFDEERMEGFIVDQMTAGIDQSHVIVAFLTQTYMQKVGSTRHNDNCKLEFNYALNRKSNVIVGVPMEPRTLDPSKWSGPVGAVLGGKLYEANFAFDIEANKPEFEKQVQNLYEQIMRLKQR